MASEHSILRRTVASFTVDNRTIMPREIDRNAIVQYDAGTTQIEFYVDGDEISFVDDGNNNGYFRDSLTPYVVACPLTDSGEYDTAALYRTKATYEVSAETTSLTGESSTSITTITGVTFRASIDLDMSRSSGTIAIQLVICDNPSWPDGLDSAVRWSTLPYTMDVAPSIFELSRDHNKARTA